jgi:phosphoglycerate dehydrogenase-like enzyme
MAKMLVIGSEERVRSNLPDLPVARQAEIAVVPRGASAEEALAAGADADFVLADAISPVTAELMARMPRLKMVQSEGVAYNAIDTKYAAEQGIYVCNNKGVNAPGVAEQTLLLILGLLKRVIPADRAVREGEQIAYKEHAMGKVAELRGRTVGLVGFGDIAQETAKRLRAFDAQVLCTKRTPLAPEEERAYGVRCVGLDELLAGSDIVSLHVPVTPATEGMANDAFFAKMREGSYLVNTARGQLVDNDACVRALRSGKLAGAAFDTLAPEPVLPDNPLLSLPEDLRDKVLFSPHIAGVTERVFPSVHRHVWENAARVLAGEEPTCVVNGVTPATCRPVR